jgi:itaconyl-CoA hydratase
MSDLPRGWFLEDFAVGDRYKHAIGRTLSEADNTWFTLLTCNTNQILKDGRSPSNSAQRLHPDGQLLA